MPLVGDVYYHLTAWARIYRALQHGSGLSVRGPRTLGTPTRAGRARAQHHNQRSARHRYTTAQEGSRSPPAIQYQQPQAQAQQKRAQASSTSVHESEPARYPPRRHPPQTRHCPQNSRRLRGRSAGLPRRMEEQEQTTIVITAPTTAGGRAIATGEILTTTSTLSIHTATPAIHGRFRRRPLHDCLAGPAIAWPIIRGAASLTRRRRPEDKGDARRHSPP